MDEIEEVEEEVVYVKDGHYCPKCQCALVEEQAFGFEKISMCPSCDYFASKTIE